MINIKTISGSKKIFVLLDQGIFSGMSFLLNMLMAHLLFASDFGLFSSIILINYLFVSVTNSLVINPLQVNLSKIKNTDRYILFSFYFQLFITGLLLLIIQLIFFFSFMKEYSYLKNPAMLFSIFFLTHDYFRKLFLAKNNIGNCLMIDSLQLITQITTFFILFNKSIVYLPTCIYALSLAYLPSLLFAISRINFKSYSYRVFKFYTILNITQGSWLLFTAFLQWASGNFFTMVSGVYLGLEALGAFRLVQSLFGVLNILLQTFENYALPVAAKLQISSIQKSKDYIKKITIQASGLFIGVLALLFIFSEKAMLIFGGIKYIEYSYIVKLMAFLYLLIYLSYPLRISIRLTKQNQFIFIGYLISFIFSLCSFHFFLKYWNLTGATIGLMVNQLLLMTYWKYILTTKKI